MSNISMAELGRQAVYAVEDAAGLNISRVYGHYVNKTKKYVSIKILTEHLTEDQIAKVTEVLSNKFPDRFLKVYNNTATPGRMDYINGEFRAHSWKEEKVNVRFTQAN